MTNLTKFGVIAAVALSAASAQAQLMPKLPFAETFNSKTADGTAFVPDWEWSFSTTLPSSYPPKWKYDGHFYLGSQKVLPPAGEGGLAYISTYDYTPEADFSITSEPVSTEGVYELEFGYNFYVPNQTSGNSSIEALVSLDYGQTFQSLHKAVFDQTSQKGWQRVEVPVSLPWGVYDVVIRITAHNSAQAVPIAVDEIRLLEVEAPKITYPSSVTDFTASLRDDRSAIDLAMTAPTHSHASLGDVLGQPLTEISRIVLLRQIGYGNDYLPIHEFVSPAPGARLTYADEDLSTCGEYYYKALVYLGDHCDFGNYVDSPITIGQIPIDVSNIKATSNRGQAPVTLTFTLPSKDLYGAQLSDIPAVSITRYNDETFVWDNIARVTENLVPGQQASYVDNNVVTDHIYDYRVIVEGTAGNSYGTTISVYVGIDAPVTPTDLVATIGEDGLVHLTWTAPTEGMNNGWIDTENLTYVVQRGNGYSDYDADLLQEGITACEYTDPTGFGEEEIVKYFVKAVSMGISGYSAISNLLIVGDPSELPFIENFNKQVNDYIQANHSTWTISSTEPASDWAFAEMAYFIMEGQALPIDNDGGLAYVYYGPYSTLHRTDWLTSGNINIENAEPQLSFWYYGIGGYDTTLDVDTSFDGGEFSNIKHIDYNTDVQTDGWTKLTLPIEAPAGAKTMQVRFAAGKGDVACSVAIDNVRVEDGGDSSVSLLPSFSGRMWTSAGMLHIEGAEGTAVAVHTTAGQTLYTGSGDCSIALAPGIYLVSLGRDTQKVIIK